MATHPRVMGSYHSTVSYVAATAGDGRGGPRGGGGSLNDVWGLSGVCFVLVVSVAGVVFVVGGCVLSVAAALWGYPRQSFATKGFSDPRRAEAYGTLCGALNYLPSRIMQWHAFFYLEPSG